MRIIGNNPAADNAEITAVASGTLPDGKPVIVNANGTVSVVAVTSVSDAIGSPVVFDSGDAFEIGICFDSNSQKIVIVYRDGNNSNYGTAIVGTVSGTSISFGTPVVYNSATTTQNTTAFDSSNAKVVVGYTDNGNSSYGTAIVGTVSGASISFGSEVVFSSSNTQYLVSIYDSGNEKIIFSYSNAGSSNSITSIVGTVSETSISFGTAADTGQDGYYTANVYDPDTGKFVLVYRDAGSGKEGEAIVGTVSSTSISYGSPVAFQSSEVAEMDATYDTSNNKVVIVYDNKANSVGSAIVGTVSGTNISFGSSANFETGGRPNYPKAAYDESAQKVAIFYEDTANNEYGTYVPATVSGTSISFGSTAVYQAGTTSYQAIVYASNLQKFVGAYQDQNNGGKSVVIQNAGTIPNLTSENYIGMSNGAVIAGVLDTSEFQDNNTTQYVSSVYDVNAERVVIAYLNNDTSNGTGGCIVGTISGSSISFGSFTTFSTGTQIGDISLTYDSTNNKCVVSYQFNTGTGQSKVATVNPSDNSITFGSAAQFSSESEQITSIFDDSSGKVVLAFRSKEGATEFDILARVGTVSGTSISYGTAATVSDANSQWVSLGNDVDSNKIVFAYLVSSQGRSKVGTVSGTNISFGNEATFTTNATYISSMAYHDALNKIILTYRDSGNSNYPTSVVGTVSGTSISFGTPVVLNSAYGGTFKRASAYNPSLEKVFTVYAPSGGSVIQDLTASGTTLVKGDTTALGQEANFECLTYISSLDKMLITYRGTDNDGYATLFVPELRGSTASGSNAIIDIGSSISTNQTSLTAGQQYFVQTNGTLGLTAASPSVIAGTAISATEIIVKG
tara:strand:- start:2159 stop:4699 length:2541 start_codon:yes stop_codon:yes gene_type:complete